MVLHSSPGQLFAGFGVGNGIAEEPGAHTGDFCVYRVGQEDELGFVVDRGSSQGANAAEVTKTGDKFGIADDFLGDVGSFLGVAAVIEDFVFNLATIDPAGALILSMTYLWARTSISPNMALSPVIG